MYAGKMQETFAGQSGAGPSGASAQEDNIADGTVEFCDECKKNSSAMLIFCEGKCKQKNHASCWKRPRIVKRDFMRDYLEPNKKWVCDACQGITRKRGRKSAEKGKKTNDDKKDDSKDNKGKKRKEDQS